MIRKQMAVLLVSGLVFSTVPGYAQERDRDEAKEKAEDARDDRDDDRRNDRRQDRRRDNAKEAAGIDDDGVNVGAIVAGVATAALVGTLVVKKTSGGKKEEGAQGSQAPISFESMDADKDSKLSRDEYLTTMKDAFKTSDADGNGTVTREEAVAAYGDGGAKYIDALDKAKTGSVEMAAMEADAAKAFDWSDANKDGFYTAEEKAAAQKAAAEAAKQ